MSMRIHGFNPIWPTLASVEQELGGLLIGIWRGTFRDTLNDSAGEGLGEYWQS